MANEGGTASDSLTQPLRVNPYACDFFHAVRLLECAHLELPRVGESRRLQDDVVWFGQNVSLGFAPSEIAEYTPGSDNRRPRMLVNFFGLLGPNGPMPLWLTEYVYGRLHRQKEEDGALRDFLDMFNHRMLSLLYRAWSRHQPCVSHDRPGNDPFAGQIASLIGLRTADATRSDVLPLHVRLHYAGRLCCPTGNAEGLRAILQDYFGVSTQIVPFIEEWITLPEHQRCLLGRSPANARIGATLIVGSSYLYCQRKFRIRLGPMGLTQYRRFLPGGTSFAELVAWTNSYVGNELTWEVQLLLHREEIPGTFLGKTCSQLGWSCWLFISWPRADADSLVLSGVAAPNRGHREHDIPASPDEGE